MKHQKSKLALTFSAFSFACAVFLGLEGHNYFDFILYTMMICVFVLWGMISAFAAAIHYFSGGD